MHGEGEKRGRGNDTSAEAARLYAIASGRRREHEVPGKSLGEYHVREITNQDCRDVTGKFSRASADAGVDFGDSSEAAGLHDFTHGGCHLDGIISVHAK